MKKTYFNRYSEFITFCTNDRRVWRGRFNSLVSGEIELENFSPELIPARGIYFKDGMYSTSDPIEQAHLDKLALDKRAGMLSVAEWTRLQRWTQGWYTEVSYREAVLCENSVIQPSTYTLTNGELARLKKRDAVIRRERKKRQPRIVKDNKFRKAIHAYMARKAS